MHKEKVSIFWFRRDLRIDDNRALYEALKSRYPVLPIFIFDTEIIDELGKTDPRITFIYDNLTRLSGGLKECSSTIYCKKGDILEVWKSILNEFDVQAVYANEDYEPYAIKRDVSVEKLLNGKGIQFNRYKDQVIFAKDEVLKGDNTPYTVFTPYKNKWLQKYKSETIQDFSFDKAPNFAQFDYNFPSIAEIGFDRSQIKVIDYTISDLDDYDEVRNFPAKNKTSYLSPHLRFGTVSIRKIVKQVETNGSFLSELIWREFFMQILFHFPKVVHSNFRSKYDNIHWRNNKEEFERWKRGETGYPMVDAGMRELNTTGYMHNRVRMVVAGFLCKHLLINWQWGEAYFAKKLLDYELSSNNGNWQWAAGTGCDAAPYFRVFNPTTQIQKFDPELIYIKKWVSELESLTYPAPMVEHKSARLRAIETYKKGIQQSSN